MPGILLVVLEELILKIVRWKLRGMLELNFGKFPNPDDFQCWRVNIKTEVCVSTFISELTMSWINEVEMAKSFDDLVTSQSIEVKYFPDFEMLDARIASALRRIISSTFFRRRVSVEEQRTQTYNRFLRGKQIVFYLSINFACRMMTSKISIHGGIRSYQEQVRCFW